MKCLVIGSGWMAQEYLKASKFIPDLEMHFYAPSTRNQDAIEKLGGSFHSDLEIAVTKVRPDHVIIASSVETLSEMTSRMLALDIPNILIEKPAFLHESEGQTLIEKSQGKSVFVGYNRRFYAAATRALEMIQQNGEKFKAVHFEFTELASDIAGSSKFSPEVKSLWAHANSSHVIDFAFFPIGLPQDNKLSAYHKGSLDWHASASEMVGAGISEKDVPFSYLASWGGVGRWSVEWITDKTRYIFKPMEKLQIQKLGTFSYEEVPLDWKYEGAKHGLVEQLEGFILGKNADRLLDLKGSLKLHKVISKIANYHS